MSANKAAVPAASGYRAYSVLKQPIFAKTLIPDFTPNQFRATSPARILSLLNFVNVATK